MCFWGRRRYTHDCILVGPVINGRPVPYYNRRVIHIPYKAMSVESGSYPAVEDGGGKFKDIKYLGRVTVPLEDHMDIVDDWLDESLKETIGGYNQDMMRNFMERILANRTCATTDEVMELDIFSAVIVNRREDQVFVYRPPSSFP